MLYRLGTYDSKTMKVIGEDPVRVIVPPMVEEDETTPASGTGGNECPVRCSKRTGSIMPGRSVFDLSYDKKDDCGYGIPVPHNV